MAVSDDEIRTERAFPVSRRALYAAFADPAVLATWWGPHGSVNAFERFELRPGGRWDFAMRAADGAGYAMRNEFVEVVPDERIVLRHLQEGHGFRIELSFDEIDASHARLRWSMRFDSADEAARVRDFVAEANEQNLDRLERALGVAATFGRRH